MRTVALFLLLSLAGCSVASPPSNSASFTPYRRVEKATDSAVRLSDADKRMLLKAGAKFVGELEVADEDIVGSEAAKVGATHYLQSAQTRFVLFRVEPRRWAELPEQLRPGMNGGDAVSTTMLMSAPMPVR